MNITFIVGNGFDIGLGLKTQYKNFYPYFIENASEKNIFVEILKKEEEKEFENWSDLEIALGKYTASFEEGQINDYINSKIEMDKLLKEYLIQQEKTLVLNDDMKEDVINALKSIRSGNNKTESETIESVFKSHQNEEYAYKVITFNYTNCIDRLWNISNSNVIGSHRYGGSQRSEMLSNIMHIHGTLYDNEMIIGLNDEGQIENPHYRNDRFFRQAMIKPNLNKAIGQKKTEEAKKMINDSSVICLYGVSIGDTDKLWWIEIGEWLKKSQNRILIIYNFDPEYISEHILTSLIHKDDVRKYFFDRTMLSEADKESIKSRIIVYDNRNVFQIEELLVDKNDNEIK